MDAMPNLDAVYAKWENKGSNRQRSFDYNAPSLGKQAWRTKFGDNISAPPHRRLHQKRRTGGATIIQAKSNSNLASFKVMPTILPDMARFRRPFMGRCCVKCLPMSRDQYYDVNNTESAGLNDILSVDTMHRSNAFLTRTFYHLSYVMKRDYSHRYPNVTKAVLNSDRVKEAIEKSTATDTVSAEVYTKKAKALLVAMKAKISRGLYRMTGWVLLKVLGRILRTIQIHDGQMAMVKKASQTGVPLLYLPLHRSHLDYILLTFILYTYDIKAPYVAAGDNLQIPFFSLLLKGLGGFFIRRRLDETPGKKDLVYRAILHSYMAALLERGAYMEFFIEGGRSRTGKACKPKGGLLSVVVDTYIEGHCPDLQIVPVSINYEKLLDGNFIREQMGEPKVKESFLGAVKGIWRVLTSNYGNVRVDFAQPFSLQEYMDSVSSSNGFTPRRSNSITMRPGCNGIKRVGSGSSLYGTDIVIEDQRQAVNHLAEHVIHTCSNSQALMSTNILSFLLLNKYREGASLKEVVSSFDWLKEEILDRGRDVGFVGKTTSVIEHAADVLGEHLVDVEQCVKPGNNNEDDIFIKPVTSLPYVFELAYYSNAVISVFLLESVIACSVCAAADLDLNTCQVQGQDEEWILWKSEILEKAVQLCEYLQYDFTFVAPCQDLEIELTSGLDKLLHSDVLKVVEDDTYGDPVERGFAQRLAKTFDDSSGDEDYDDDQELRVNVFEQHAVDRLIFLQRVISPFIETYWLVAFSLTKLLDSDMTESEFVDVIQKFAFERVNNGVACFGESVSMDTIKNAMKVLQHMKITEVYYDSSETRMIGLQNKFNSKDSIYSFISSVESFRM